MNQGLKQHKIFPSLHPHIFYPLWSCSLEIESLPSHECVCMCVWVCVYLCERERVSACMCV